MIPRQQPNENQYGTDVSKLVPRALDLVGVVALSPTHVDIWQLAEPHLKVRSNDAHTIYSYGLARALVDLHPNADPEVVLPAIILHDTGWSTVPEEDVLSAIAPGAGRHDLVIQHEKQGARIAREVLGEVGWDVERTEQISSIIDGHDTRREAISLDDAIMKDADKLWRLTPHGVDTVMNWFGLTREEAHRLISSRVHDHLLTDAGRIMARALGAIASIDTAPQRLALG